MKSPYDAYQKAGVDIPLFDEFVHDTVAPCAQKTKRQGVMENSPSGFAAPFDIKACGFKDPVLFAASDGVGTKLKLAQDAPASIKDYAYASLGQDLVAMCVNDLASSGAHPLFFLDYIALHALDKKMLASLMEGMSDACHEVGAALIGGETAEMPLCYAQGQFDLAGFAIGAAERAHLLSPANVQEGDCLIALPSSGCHANGFSLIHRTLKKHELALDKPAPFDENQTLRQALLTPTKLYSPIIKEALFKDKLIITLAHITGGGIRDNLPRSLPPHLTARLDLTHYTLPPIHQWLFDILRLSQDESLTVFNGGIGMIAITRHPRTLLDCWKNEGAFLLGSVVKKSNNDGITLS